jgi:hypothetical protein
MPSEKETTMAEPKNLHFRCELELLLDRILPKDQRSRCTPIGNELLLPYDEALKAISIAGENQIAILGLEAFEVTKDGLLTVDMADASSNISFTGDWRVYVARMNVEAQRWLREHPLGEKHAYVLTSTSEKEFADLRRRVK